MEYRNFGNTGFRVSCVGFGAGHIGDGNAEGKAYESLLNTVLDLGINLIDTARAYGFSEKNIGRYIAHRRSEFILSTKVGYNDQWHPDWSYETVIANVDEALKLMRTDYLDIVHLHSCSLEVLEKGEATAALEKAREQGKIRAAAYSGENEALGYAIESKRFASLQTSINFCDQRGISNYLPGAKKTGMGVIAKRPIANAPWRHTSPPVGHYSEEYWHRWKKMNPDAQGLNWDELALRFTAFTEGVDTCILGTSSIGHLKIGVEAFEKGPLSPEIYTYLREGFKTNDTDWVGLI
ncbi:MAG: aldo/keto reductase [Bacteroidetes bacterium]|nr:aldo/keto reductase [Bacteroidota bacterium]